jgi:hypothetical protein
VKHGALVTVAALCALAGYATERFGYELCHHGVPLVATALAAPALGLAANALSVARRPPLSMFGLNTIIGGLNIYFVAHAIRIMAGVGYLSCR